MGKTLTFQKSYVTNIHKPLHSHAHLHHQEEAQTHKRIHGLLYEERRDEELRKWLKTNAMRSH